MARQANDSMRSARPPIWTVVRSHLRADPRKTGILIALTVVMVVVYLRMFSGSDVPGAANASAAAVKSTSPAGARQDDQGVGCDRLALDLPIPRELARNPLLADLSRFPSIEGTDGGSVDVADPPERTGDGSKPGPVADLVLQITSCGDAPLACINGQIVRPGESIEGFVLQRVAPTHVVLRRGHLDVILKLK
jgi:hypothetical protein